MKRTFIAVKIKAEEKLTEMISDIRDELRNDSIKWADVSNMHITIAFLGDTAEESVEKVSAMLQKKCSGTGNFSFRLSGLGIFRNINDIRVLWTGIDDTGKLRDLHRNVKTGLDEAGIKTEDRDFNPHLTLGRVKWIHEKPKLQNLLEKYKTTIFQDVRVGEVIFYESILSQSGPTYIPLTTIKL